MYEQIDLNKRLINSFNNTSMDKKVKNKQEGQGSKERILDVAVKLFASQGYAGTGLRELSAGAQVNLAMINYFFGSKKGLLREILDVFFAEYLLIAERHLRGKGLLAEKLERFVYHAVFFFDSRKDYLLVTINELPHDDPEILEYKAAWAKKMIGIIDTEICRPLAERGELVSPTMLGPLVTASMASRFLFAPIIDRIRPGQHGEDSLEAYAQMISKSLQKVIC